MCINHTWTCTHPSWRATTKIFLVHFVTGQWSGVNIKLKHGRIRNTNCSWYGLFENWPEESVAQLIYCWLSTITRHRFVEWALCVFFCEFVQKSVPSYRTYDIQQLFFDLQIFSYICAENIFLHFDYQTFSLCYVMLAYILRKHV